MIPHPTRNVALDVARGLSIFLIVLSHTSFSYSYLFTFFYVQVFFFLSGIFMKSSDTMENCLYKKVKSLIYPYLFFATISSVAVLMLGRNTIDGIHLYEPDSFDNGPLWFLIALFTLNIVCLFLNELPKCMLFLLGGVIFGTCYCLGLNGIDDYTDITKAGISLPFLFAGNYYLKIEPFFRKYRYVIFLFSISLCALFIWVMPVHIGIRWIELPDNILLYLLASFSGIALILSISYIMEPVSILCRTLSFLGLNSLFILCMHWPIVRMLYDEAHIPNSDIIAFVVGFIMCFVTAGIGVILKKYCSFFFK